MNEQEIFEQALELSAKDRSAFVIEACGEDQKLRERIECLLNLHDAGGEFFEQPAANVLATEITAVTEQPGDAIGPYKLLQQIGEGGMGVVYMAEQTHPVERRVALKIIKPGMDTRQVIARFEAERQALAMMDHPNIAKVLDAGQTDTGRPYFVMELVKGMPVTQYCDEQHLSPRERLELFVPICQAVQHAHQKGVIHRDLKPTNILIAHYDDKPVPKIIDFGVAKAISHNLTEKTMFTQYGQIVGTIEYMSPEQARFNQLDVDTRSDVYSLGVLLYELLTGETPFDKKRLRAAAIDELLRIIREEEPPCPSTKLSSSETLANTAINRKTEPNKLSLLVRGELDWIVMKALEKDRGRRYETASAFAQDIQHYLNDEAVIACPPSVAYKFRKLAHRNKAAIVTTSAIAASLIIGSSIAIWQAIETGKERDRALIAERNAIQEAERATQAETLAEERLAIVSRQKDQIAEEKRRADREASIAKAVNDFLNRDLLGMANSESQVEEQLTPNPDIKLRTVLDRAADAIDEKLAGEPLLEAAIRHTIGATYYAIGEFTQAEEQMKRALQIQQNTLGREHTNTLSTLNDLANVFHSQGRFAEAEQLFQQMLEIRRRTLGEQHPDTLSSLHNLAGVFCNQHRYDEAQQLNQQTLELRKRVLGNEHAETLKSMHNLALVYREQGRYVEAEQLLQQTMEVQQRTLGNSHPFTLCSMHNLARVIDLQGHFQEAERLYQQTLAIRKRTLGEQHPATLRSMHNLAMLYCHQRRCDEAEQLNQQTLAIRRQTLGEKHPDTLSSMHNLAIVFCKQHRYDEAEQLNRQTLAIRKRILGDEHADTLKNMHSLAFVYREQGRYDEAEQLLRQTMETQQRTLGDGHPFTLRSMDDLARVIDHQGRFREAEQLYQQTLTIRRRTLGEEHSATLRSMFNLAMVYCHQRRYDEAEPLIMQTLEIQKRTLGDEHADTLRSMHNLAVVFTEQGRYDEAKLLCQQMLEIQKSTLGDEHSLSLRSLHHLIVTMISRKQCLEAETLAREFVDALRQNHEQQPDQLLYAMQNLLITLNAQHKYTELEEVYRQAYEIATSKLIENAALRIRLEEGYARFCTNRSWILATAADPALRDSREAVRLAEIAAELRPQDANNFSNLAVALYRNGQFVEAVDTFGKADEMVEGGDLAHRMFYAMAQWQLGNVNRAMKLYREGDAWIEAKRKISSEHLRYRAEAKQMLEIDPIAELRIEQPLRAPPPQSTPPEENP